ncbi:helix-turn-helix domain-containing protein [Priestia megaterium]|uniref:helix-turn-helix domain-containing protein n=1 Tax=Priestia megaterium TaxID=1404 RepID=UPI00137538CE|nr:helix-turn-helix domain-containing protein [Priestia megaterium]
MKEDFTNSIKEGYCTTKELAKIFDVHPSTPNTWIRKKIIKEYRTVNNSFQIARSEIPRLKKFLGFNEEYNKEDYLSLKEVAHLIGFNYSSIKKREDVKELAVLHCNFYYLSKDSIPEIKKRLGIIDHESNQYLSADEIATQLSINKEHANSLIRTGLIRDGSQVRLKDSKKVQWVVPQYAFDEYLKGNLIISNNKKPVVIKKKVGYLSVNEVAEKLSTSRAIIYRLVRLNKIEGMVKEATKWFIPESSLDDIKSILIDTKNKNTGFTKDMAKDMLLEQVNSCHINSETRSLFIGFSLKKIESNWGNENTLYGKALLLIRLFNKILLPLNEDIVNLEVEKVKAIINDTSVSIEVRQLFLRFLSYSYSERNIVQNEKYFIAKEKKEKDNEIYSPTIYQSYFVHVQDIDLHIPKAIKNKHYANMWLFVIMHLIDVWRASDIVRQLPHIDTKTMEINDLDWFSENRFSIEQSQLIINTVHLKTKYLEANKNSALLTFLVQPDMVLVTATVMAICELHRRKKDDQFLLQTFSVGKTNRINSANKKHLKFFNGNSELEGFSSLKMNRTTLTYLFYSLEESTNDADIALEYGRIARSHRTQDTTSIYVASTNKDGSVNRISMNLFKRGLFGWLYNYMVSTALNTNNRVQTIEDRTFLIEKLKGRFSLLELEGWAEYISKARDKQSNVIINLSGLGVEEFTILIRKVFEGKMPSRTEHGQCLCFPKCFYPKRHNCFGCEYFLPEMYVLVEASIEFKRLIASITKNKYEVTLRRDSELLKHVLLIFEEAVIAFGDERINAFLPKTELNKGLNLVIDKLLLD